MYNNLYKSYPNIKKPTVKPKTETKHKQDKKNRTKKTKKTKNQKEDENYNIH